METHPRKEKHEGAWSKIGGWATVAFGAVKFLPGLLKLGKAGGTLISMLITIGAYALVFPWSFSIGLVAMIFIHEMGHIWAARHKKLPVSAPAFIPFLGALITLKKLPQDAETEAYVALGGPLVGSAGAFVCYLLGVWTGWEVLSAIAAIGFIINLFNLLPIHPLDGGRIVTAISRWFWAIGLVGGLALIIYTKSLLLIVIWLLFAFELWEAFFSRRRGKLKKVTMVAEADVSQFLDRGLPIPAGKDRRDLPFQQYCSMDDQEHWCDIYYPGIGIIHRMNGFSGFFEGVSLTKTDVKKGSNGDEMLKMSLEAQYMPGDDETMLRKDKAYYQVAPRVRLAYGTAYLGLATFLVYMLYKLGTLPLMDSSVVS
ncbi:Zn-dependent protease (includes SpoIVFB) [Marininema mesophilum]|uniref:Zn-dependent protease (Includes SpoIVFB) n=1 Tax=Marininema mesophilum TaxID=1048340 RepID=A0A1H2X6C3_9BACL|nr:site-2 protease family protein [Marininema mesophilum]SDW88440.1 Zn-dependent protease (includes SpoIVFB) [Marininema mesophilum]